MALKKYEFNSVFQELQDESLELKKSIEVSGVVYEAGTKFKKDVAYGGVNFHLYKNRALAVELTENSEGPIKIIGFYPD